MIYLLCGAVCVFGGLMVGFAWKKSYQENTVAVALIGAVMVVVSVWFIGTAVRDDIARESCTQLSAQINKPTRYDSYNGCKVRYKQQWIPTEEFDRMQTQ